MAFQETLRDIDAGTTSKVLKVGMVVVILAAITTTYFLNQFKGLGTEQAMDQAQIARSLISKEGFSTRYIRPLAIRVLTDAKKENSISAPNFPEFYNAPLFPLLEAAALFPVKDRIQMAPTDTLSTGDRAIEVLGIVLLFLVAFVWYHIGLLLFDRTLALISSGLLLLTDLIWQYALAGLPQLLLTLLFGVMTYCAIKAQQADAEDAGESNISPSLPWLAGAAFALGLMSLAHGVAAFLLPGFIVFTFVGFHGRISTFVVSFLVYVITVSPWLAHNFVVCGNPFGLSIYAAVAGAGIPESEIMRGVNTGLALGLGMATKFRTGLLDQASHLWEYFGLNLAVVFFLPSLLHSFRSSIASLWRWIALLMWVSAALGMTLFGVKGAVSGNQLHIVFLPIFVLYGTAFLLVLWNRLAISDKAFRIVFLSIVFLISATPMILTLVVGQAAKIQWPPYVPPFIAVLNKWYGPDELLSSDMPWAVAWYANRKCLLLPETIRGFNEISDYGTLGSPIVGLYLTPISGDEEFTTLIKGKYKEWGPVIMRTINLDTFLLKSFTPLPIDGECILYADSERWARRTDQQ